MVFALLRRRTDKQKAEKQATKSKLAPKGSPTKPTIEKVVPPPEAPLLVEAPKVDIPENVSNV